MVVDFNYVPAFKNTNQILSFISLVGIFAGPIIYLAQVLFNFGVVAILFLFYFLLGIGLSFINDEYEYNNGLIT